MRHFSFFLLSFFVILPAFAADTSTGANFVPQKFSSCTEMKSTLSSLLSVYWQDFPIGMDDGSPTRRFVTTEAQPLAALTQNGEKSSSMPVSSTNIQVDGVDESDIVKTDGQNIYIYRQMANTLEIVRASDLHSLATIRPESDVSGITFYITKNRLVTLGTKNPPFLQVWSYRWYYPNNKTSITVYDTSTITAPKILHSHVVDGYIHDSRLIGDTLYFLTQSDFRIAPIYPMLYAKGTNPQAEVLKSFDANFSLKNVLPEIREKIPNPRFPKRYIQTTRTAASDCRDVTFLLPKKDTLASYALTPTFTVVGTLDVAAFQARIESSLILGAVSQMYMSQDSLYLLSNVGKHVTNSCPPGRACFAPPIYDAYTTLVHRLSLNHGKPLYQNTTEVQGNPLSQYSMDEDKDGNFRLVTQEYAWTSTGSANTTRVSIIHPSGKVIGSLSGLARGENFQSARFIGNRLYLVTFQQIDPLFSIDLSTPTAPRVLGELKIPGYSTYLHPYDDNRLIGIGYDTYQNANGGIQNGGLKIDLYNVADIKNPLREQTLTLGDAGSSSDVLSNPRAFVWYKEKNLLLLPATLMKNATKDANNPYRYAGAFQGIVGISITPQSISEKFRISHLSPPSSLESAWKKECSSYSTNGIPACVTLIDGSKYCSTQTQYVPTYCYAGATVDEYFAYNLWNSSSDFITRALYVGDALYSVAESGLNSWNLNNPSTPLYSLGFPMEAKNPYPRPIPVDTVTVTR